MRKLLSSIMVLLAGALIAGCGGGRSALDPAVIVEEEPIQSVTGEVSTIGLGNDVGASSEGLAQSGDDTGSEALTQSDDDDGDSNDDSDLLTQRVIYFEYDSSLLTAEGEAIVQAHARYLNGVSNVRIILEGHADERGTREYNLALAEDRAKAVASLVQVLGVDARRIQTVSYGEERPVALGHDASAWSLNRRVEILYQ